MKTHLLRLLKQSLQLITRITFLLVALGFFAAPAFSQIATSTPASRCGAGEVVLKATATTGTIKWYDVPFYGTALATGPSFTTPSLAVTKTYYVDAVSGTPDCSVNPGNARVTVIATISSGSIQAAIFYASTTFCKSLNGTQEVTRTGTAGGVYSSTPGLTLDASTGAITPSSSNNGTYTVTYHINTPASGCTENDATTQVTITTAPLISSISYTGSPFCTSGSAVTVNLVNPNSGTFSASPSGLNINAGSGIINPSSSLPGNYTITYFVSGAGGCAPQTKTANITITGSPTATLSYSGSPFCQGITTATPTLTGTGAYMNGTYSASGITVDASTGVFNPSASTAGTYTIYYTAPASANCGTVQVSASVTINLLPTATITAPAIAEVCVGADSPLVTFTGAGGTAPYTFTYTIDGGAQQTVSTSGSNSATVAVTTMGAHTFTYTLVKVTDASTSACYKAQTGKVVVTVNNDPSWDAITSPVASITYGGSVSFSATVKDGMGGSVTWIRSNNVTAGTGTEETVTNGDIPPSVGTWYYRPHFTPTGSGCDLADGTQTAVTVNQKELTVINAVVTTKPYDGNATAAITLAELSGVFAGDAGNVTLGNATAGTFNNSSVGSGKSVATTPMTISGSKSGNYYLTQPTLTGEITAIELTVINAVVTTKPYEGNATAAITLAELSGVLAGDAGNVTLGNATAGTFNNASVGSGKSVATTPMTISGSKSGNYYLTQPTLTGEITAIELTVINAVVTTKPYDGNATAAITLAELSGVLAGDVANVTLGNATAGTFNNASVGSGKSVTTTPMTISGTKSGNYYLTPPTLTGNITQKALTVINSVVTSKPYDGNTDAAITGATLSGKVGTEDVVLGNATTGTFAQAGFGTGINVSTAPMTISGADIANYTLTQPALTGDITKATITELAITGITAPVSGATPVTVATNSVQFAATVTWSPIVTTTFASGTIYTATISITPTANYTLTGVRAMSFTVSGATGVVNSDNLGIVGADFPGTVPDAPTGAAEQTFCTTPG